VKFKVLQENLRKTLWRRIEEGELTGLHLAEQTGFKQAHISNFLNRKRGLSLEGMDKVLKVQRLSVLDLLDPHEINRRASIQPPSEDEFENVLVVDGAIAATEPLVMSKNVREILKFKKTFLHKLRPEMEGDRDKWERFVVVKADGREGMSMYPRLLPGATILIDRHYNSLHPYRKHDRNVYAVRSSAPDSCALGYVELAGPNLLLRPHNREYPVSVVAVEPGLSYAEHIVGRVCHAAMEA